MAVLTVKAQQRADREIIALLEELGGKSHIREDDVLFEGDKIILPKTMNWKRLKALADDKIREENETDSWTRSYLYRPWDGAWCMLNALRRVFGAVSVKGTASFWGQQPPQFITIPSGVGETVQVPWGNLVLPGHLPGVTFHLGQNNDPERGSLFHLSASGPKKLEGRVMGIFNLVLMELESNSLYRGKAFDGQEMPEFIDVYAIDRNHVVYSEHVRSQMEASVWAHLKHTATVERAGLKMKRSVLLYGPFGTGKTLGATVTAQHAVENGWTFIKGRPGRDNISMLFQTGLLYQPCVVFCEDVEAEMEGASRSSINRLLDDFDGIQTKGTKLLCVMTTNYPERIEGGFIRPGRIDDTIRIDDLDVAGVAKLIELQIGERLADDVNWDEVFAHAEGYKPAYVSEMAQRTTLYQIAQHGPDYDQHAVTTEHLVHSADGLRDQYDLQQGAKKTTPPAPLEVAQRNLITEAVTEVVRANTDSDYHSYDGNGG